MGRYTFGFEVDVRDNAKGLRQLYFRVTYEKAKAKIGTGLYIKHKDFNPKSRDLPVRRGCDDHAAYNAALKRRLKQAEELTEELGRKGISLTAAEFKDRLLGKDDGSTENLVAYGRRWLERHAAKLAHLTTGRYANYLNRLEQYLGGKPLPFSKLTYAVLLDYQQWLMSPAGGGNSVNTSNKSLQCLKTIVKQAVDEGLLEYHQNPFLKLKLSFEKVKRPRLTPGEIDRLRSLQDLTRIERIARDLWLWQYNTAGTRFGDAVRAKWRQIVEGRWHFTMEKTGAARSVKLSKEALELIERYRTPETKLNDYIFPLLDSTMDYSDPVRERKAVSSKTAQVNDALKRVAAKAEIDKNLSTHIARHSFATQARKLKVPVVSIQGALAHEHISDTEGYLEELDEEAGDEAIDAVTGG